MKTVHEVLSEQAGRRLVFTNGVFDILHAGHVQYLAEARKLGDMLIVGLNSDASVRRLGKGEDRPVNPLDDRATVLEALRAVDAVIAFDEDTPVELIRVLKPDVHVKGGDYSVKNLPETSVVQAYGGEVVILPLLQGRSTTGILGRLNAQ